MCNVAVKWLCLQAGALREVPYAFFSSTSHCLKPGQTNYCLEIFLWHSWIIIIRDSLDQVFLWMCNLFFKVVVTNLVVVCGFFTF